MSLITRRFDRPCRFVLFCLSFCHGEWYGYPLSMLLVWAVVVRCFYARCFSYLFFPKNYHILCAQAV